MVKSLRVINNLIPLNNETFAWHSIGDNPQFFMGGRLPSRGWNMLELSLEHNTPSALARFYFDTGHGFRDEESIVLPLRAGRIARRLCYFSATLKAICIQPLESKGKFTIHHFRFTWLMPWLAHNQLTQRLANMHHFYRGHQKMEVMKKIKAEARVADLHWREIALKRYDETFAKRCATRSYSSWIEQTEKPRLPCEKTVTTILDSLSFRPIISVLLPIYNTDVNHLRECIESVLKQSYVHWQLCIADDASTSAHVRSLIEEYAARDEKILFEFRQLKGHVVAASNSALVLATGEYIALLDHGDLLAEHALLKVVQVLNDQPEAGVLYSDEDKIDVEGRRFDPCFKPGWNTDLLLSQNYISHLCVYKSDLVNAVGGFREAFKESYNHDLLLRCASQLQDEQIVHIPEILYHCRAVARSIVERPVEQNNTTMAGVDVLTHYFSQSASNIVVKPGPLLNTYRVHWPIPEERPLVSLIIPTRDGYEILKRCVNSILEKTTYDHYEIIILNNQSRCPDTLKYLRTITADKRVTVHAWDYPFNYSAINNFGATKSKGSILGLVNNDVEVINPDWLDEMVSHVCREAIGCVGAKLYYPNETVQHAGVILGLGGVAGHAHKYFSRSEHGYFSRLKLVQNFSAVTGACLLVRKAIFEQVGGLDEEHLAVAFNDVDFCLKVREAGFRNLWTPYAELYHHESVSRGADNTNKKRLRAQREAKYMREKWGQILDIDPAYNPNLTLIHEDFSLK